MTMKRFVFDFGAVLFAWQPVQLLRQVMPEHAHDDASAAGLVGQVFQNYGGDWAEFDKGTVAPQDLVPRIASRTGLPESALWALVDAIPDALTPLAASVNLVQQLRRPGTPMFYLSNMPAPYADELERRHDFVRDFDAGVFSGRVQLVKPDPQIFALAAQRFGTAPGDLVFLDDHLPNVKAAQAAGWNALHFSDAANAAKAIRDAGWWPD